MKDVVEKAEGKVKAHHKDDNEEEDAEEDLVASEEENSVLSPISVEYEPLGVHRYAAHKLSSGSLCFKTYSRPLIQNSFPRPAPPCTTVSKS